MRNLVPAFQFDHLPKSSYGPRWVIGINASWYCVPQTAQQWWALLDMKVLVAKINIAFVPLSLAPPLVTSASWRRVG